MTTTSRSRSIVSLVRLLAEYVPLKHRPGPRDARLDTFEKLLGDPVGGSRRAHARVPLRLRAKIAVAGRSVPARVLDIGGGGARIQWGDPAALPAWTASLELLVPDEERGIDHVFDCHLRWRDGYGAGLRFVGQPRRVSRALSTRTDQHQKQI